MDEPFFDADDAIWEPVTSFKAHGAWFFYDRELTRWEWVKVHVFHRRDPRQLGYVTFEEGDLDGRA